MCAWRIGYKSSSVNYDKGLIWVDEICPELRFKWLNHELNEPTNGCALFRQEKKSDDLFKALVELRLLLGNVYNLRRVVHWLACGNVFTRQCNQPSIIWLWKLGVKTWLNWIDWLKLLLHEGQDWGNQCWVVIRLTAGIRICGVTNLTSGYRVGVTAHE